MSMEQTHQIKGELTKIGANTVTKLIALWPNRQVLSRDCKERMKGITLNMMLVIFRSTRSKPGNIAAKK